MKREAIDRFVESWGNMGSVWGINTSLARVHALLIASDGALSLDEVARRLEISRGNASMCLRDLRTWGVVRLVKQPGDRKDYYTSEPDVWKMFFAILRERKRRELDPTVAVLREIVGQLSGEVEGEAASRLRQMQELLATMNGVAERLFADEQTARSMLALVGAIPASVNASRRAPGDEESR